MFELQERAVQFNEGLISAREFLGFVIDIVGREWTILGQNEDDQLVSCEMAQSLAARLSN